MKPLAGLGAMTNVISKLILTDGQVVLNNEVVVVPNVGIAVVVIVMYVQPTPMLMVRSI